MVRRKKVTNKGFRLEGYIFGSLRRIWGWYPPKREALRRALVAGKFKCAQCSSLNLKTGVQVDHTSPCMPVTGFDNWDAYINRLFCPVEGLAVLCKPCHAQKSKIENALRRKNKKEKVQHV